MPLFGAMYYGTFHHTMDSKGRVNVPSKFRDILRASGDDRLYITQTVSQDVCCLDIYPPAAWLAFLQKLREMDNPDPEIVNFFQNFYLASAQECQVDKQGRVLVPPELREYASLDKDVVFVGAIEKFRLWDRDAFAPVRASGEQTLRNNPNIISRMGI